MSAEPAGPPPLTGDEHAELMFLRAENALLRTERDILVKAAGWFAADAGVLDRRTGPEPR
ncbi:hypothetical protein ACFORO_27715 [Amycolatopsis halotolerans]|uniref:Transposase n=1 Tax=Amycolatopsis halotolerans TaxID=330083 RepID=A0ABV7QPY8_9PSEU